jgi:hypothetical protein
VAGRIGADLWAGIIDQRGVAGAGFFLIGAADIRSAGELRDPQNIKPASLRNAAVQRRRERFLARSQSGEEPIAGGTTNEQEGGGEGGHGFFARIREERVFFFVNKKKL